MIMLRSFAIAATAAISLAFTQLPATAQQVLYGTTGAGFQNPSTLFTIDPATGTATPVGPIGFEEVSSIDFDPITGTLYGISNGDTSAANPDANTLITIDTATGTGTAVATITYITVEPSGIGPQSPDMSFDSAGVLYSWTESQNDNLVTIDLATGVATEVSDSGLQTAGIGLDVDSTDTIYLKDRFNGVIYTIDAVTGLQTSAITFLGQFDNILAFDENDGLYTVDRIGGSGGSAVASDLYTIDLTAGTAMLIGPTGLGGLAALAFAPAGTGVDANAGPGQTVDEGAFVILDGTASAPAPGTETFSWSQIAGTSVALSGAIDPQPTFTAPSVAIGGETLTFELTYAVEGDTDTSTVDITVVNMNHIPVADAGDDQSVIAGTPVALDGSDSFDIDNDTLTFSWVQTGGTTVTLLGATTAMPTFTATATAGTLVFSLTVDDGFPPDAPAPGFPTDSNTDTVSIEVTAANNPPAADAGAAQSTSENSAVILNGTGSSDPDMDPLTFSWVQIGGPTVTLTGANTSTPSFTTPFVGTGGEALIFELTVNDGNGGTATAQTTVNVQNESDPPDVGNATPTVDTLWPPNHMFVSVGIIGIVDPENETTTITIDSVFQDEPTSGLGSGDTAIDAIINADGTVLLRAERSGTGDGRVYQINFTASDLEGSSSGTVFVNVPLSKKDVAVNGGPLFDSTQ